MNKEDTHDINGNYQGREVDISDTKYKEQWDSRVILNPTSINIDGRFKNSLLDIGGAGEYIIYHATLHREELQPITIIDVNEEPRADKALNYMMDAGKMNLDDRSYQTVTAFYSFMYMEDKIVKGSIRESYRVLNHGGSIYIWDICTNEECTAMIEAPVKVQLKNGKVITANYGSLAVGSARSKKYYLDTLEKEGFKIRVTEYTSESGIYIHAEKQ